MLNYTLLRSAPRVLLQAELRPVQGDRFQPTGFADLGAAEYTRPDETGVSGTRMLLVESAQSVANRLEKTCLDGDGPKIDPELDGLPYVLATLTDASLPEPIFTSSLVEPHRLASPYFLRSEFANTLGSEMACTGKGPLSWKKIDTAFFKYDPNCLIHGVFLSLLDGRVRVPRALSGFIEAENVKQVVSGGVKNSPVDPKGEIQVASAKPEKGVYSNVPYSRVEYVAGKIVAFFNLDTLQIRAYGLGEAATQLLIALSLLKVQRFLASDLRLRTACNLGLSGKVMVTAPEGFVLPEEKELLSETKRLIALCKPQFASPAVTLLTVPVKKVKSSDSKSVSPEQNSEGTANDNS